MTNPNRETMKHKESKHLHPAIDRELAAVARSSKATPPWHDAWSRLGLKSTHEERLNVCQAIRDAGTLPEDDGYFLVCWAAEHLAEEEDDARPADPLRTVNTFEAVRASERAFADLLDRQGEAAMAKLFRSDRKEYERRREAGRLSFFGPAEDEEAADPGWLDRLLRAIAARVVASIPVEALACRHSQGCGFHEVHVCPPAGLGWAVDIEGLREAFDDIDGCGWYAAPAGEGDGPYLWIEGEFDGQEVFLRLLQSAEAGKDYQT
jgi:hypothetical protein